MAKQPDANAPDLATLRRMLDEDHHLVELAERFAAIRHRVATQVTDLATAAQYGAVETLAGDIHRRSGG